MTDIFPFIDPQEYVEEEEIAEKELPMAKEWAWDFEKNEFKIRNGKMYIVEGDEAIKIWVWKIFQTPRYRYLIYDWDYGHELEDFVGHTGTREYIKAEVARMVEEAIYATLEGYVLNIYDLDINIKNDKLNISFKIDTPYNEGVEVNGIQI